MADIQTQNPAPAVVAPPAPKSGVLSWLGAAGVAVAVFAALQYFNEANTHETTDDAFIAGHIIAVAPRISGQVTTVAMLDNQLVHSNDLLVVIDPADLSMTLTQKVAGAEAQEASYQALKAGIDLMQTKRATARAVAQESQADADAASATADRAKADATRAQELRQQKTISAQEFDTTQAAAQTAAANLNSARQKLVADTSRIKEAEAQLAAMQFGVTMEQAKTRQSRADVAAAQLNLSYTKIYAPADGRVTRKAVEAGDYVQAGQALLALVPAEVWVVANFKESQLRAMHPGQPALVTIDALGGRSFKAHVDSIQAGSGAQFSLLPPENATGNFVKVVQRVPVKIVFDEPLPGDRTLGPGLSVSPSVAVGGFQLPPPLAILLALVAGVVAGLMFQRFNRSPKPAA